MGRERTPNDLEYVIVGATRALSDDPGVLFAYLFGSLARKTISPLSDVDIAVYLDDAADPAERKLEILGKLMDCLGRDDIDLVVLNSASLPLRARIIRDGQLLVDRRPHLRHSFESLALRQHLDFSLFEGAILRRRFALG